MERLRIKHVRACRRAEIDGSSGLHMPPRTASPEAAARQLRASCPLRPTLALVLGSGFQGVADRLEIVKTVPGKTLPGFPSPAVAGHAGQVLFARLGGVPVLALNGRAHYYEGHALDQVTFPVRALAAFGIRDLLLTNAAGGINPRFQPGDFMVIDDHINGMGANPLRGMLRRGRPDFLDLTDTYDPAWRRRLRQAALRCGARVHSGVYLAVCGPSYETPAEIRAFARWGADAVGMSTVPEAVVARHCGLKVAAVSCITNRAAGLKRGKLSHSEVLATAERVKHLAVQMLEQAVKSYDEQKID